MLGKLQNEKLKGYTFGFVIILGFLTHNSQMTMVMSKLIQQVKFDALKKVVFENNK